MPDGDNENSGCLVIIALIIMLIILSQTNSCETGPTIEPGESVFIVAPTGNYNAVYVGQGGWSDLVLVEKADGTQVWCNRGQVGRRQRSE